MDWDRYAERWRGLDGMDDGQRFEQMGLEDIASGVEEIVLAVSVSYRVELEGISKKLPGLPIVRLELPEGSADGHWAATKQEALAQTFLAHRDWNCESRCTAYSFVLGCAKQPRLSVRPRV